MNSLLYSTPLLRILLPYIAGILASRLFLYAHLSAGFWVASLLGAAGVAGIICAYRLDYRHRWLGGAWVVVLSFALGLGMACLSWRKSCVAWPEEEAVYRVRLLDAPERRTRSFSCEVQVAGYYPPQLPGAAPPPFEPLPGKALVYLGLSNPDTSLLEAGRVLLLRMRLEPPRNYGNPEEFDYRFFLSSRGFSATGYASRWAATPLLLQNKGLAEKARRLRGHLLARYRESGFHKAEDYGLLAALTLGSKENLTREQRERYSDAGIGHILVVSGLHVGLVFCIARALLSLLCPFFLYYAKQAVALAAVWGFAFVCGLAPPVLRSAIALSVWVLANLSGYGHKPGNTLALAALALLVWNPLWGFDVGFQLSFAAVAGILLWNDWIFSLLRVRRFPWSDVVSRSAAVCIAAQLGIFPLLACHFSSFPTWFLLANLPAVFLCQLVIGVGALLLLLGSHAAFVGKCCVFLLGHLLEILEGLVRFTNSLPFATVDRMYVPWWEGCCIALFLFALLRTLRAVFARRRCRVLPLLLVSLALTACEAAKAFAFRPPREGLFFYALPSAPAVQGFAPGRPTVLWTDSTATGYPFLRRQLQNYWDKVRLLREEPYTAHYDGRRCLFRWQGRTLLRLDGGWAEASRASAEGVVDYLWIVRGYGRSFSQLPQGLEFRTVVLDASLAPALRKRLAGECEEAGIPYVDLGERGAVYFDFLPGTAK